ncbi:reductase [Salmonella enterica subsp. enterica]|uniref:Reductase n=1 Tax=Salmonella enterica I TaxID=59201 RepID=A0A3S4G0M8_SALET|nr:reductase [Salmonella enterica subsp. enterica]
MTLTEIVAKVDTGAEKRAAEALNKRDAYDVLIVGSGPAGAAARSTRLAKASVPV